MEKPFKQLSKEMSDLIDLKMREYIAVLNNNAPHEKSIMIAELQKNNAVILTRLDNQDKILKEIKDHVEHTNGRVLDLEKDNSSNRGWIKGIGVLIGVVVTLIGLVYVLTVKNIDAQITNLHNENEIKSRQ